MTSIKWYHRQNIDQCPWGAGEDAQYARAYLLPMIKAGVSTFIRNVDTELCVLQVDDCFLPVTINQGEYGNSYVVSPYGQYIVYAKEELYLLKQPIVEAILRGFLNVVGTYLRAAHFNKVVIVNNWMLSTNLYPDLTETQLRDITLFLRQKYPEHAIVFRSIETYRENTLSFPLQKIGYRLLLGRQTFFMDLLDGKGPKSRYQYNLRKDVKVMENAREEYTVASHEQISEQDIARILATYNDLYLDKYSMNNPQFTKAFIELARKTRIFHLKALKKAGSVDAVLGYFKRNGMMTTPLFGYDTTVPQSTGLYRILSLLLMKEAQREGLILHASSGAAEFKRSRGAVERFEYNAVYLSHLPFFRRLPWLIVDQLLERIGKPLFKKYQL